MADSNKRTLSDRLSLRSKVTIILLAISLGPLLMTGMVNVNRAMERGRQSEGAHFAQSAMFTAAAFADLFNHVRTDLQAVARRFPAERFDYETIRSGLEAGQGLRPSLAEWRDAPFQTFMGEEYSGFFLTLADGEVFYSLPYRNVRSRVTLEGQPWFSELPPRGRLVSTGIPKLLKTGQGSATFVVPLVGQDGERRAYLGASLQPSRLREIALRMFRDHDALGKSGSLALVSPSGEIIAHNNQSLVGTTLPAAFSKISSGSTVETDPTDQEPALVATAAAVGSTGWRVLLTAPVDNVYRYLNMLVRVLIVVTVITFAFILLLADYLARLLLRPIEELERGAQMIGAGALDYRIELNQHRQDELGRLAKAFNDMGDNLVQTQKQLRAYSRSLETANEELDAMLFAITHDLRRSLRGIESYAGFLEQDYGEQLGANGCEMLRTITLNTTRMKQLANDLVGLVESDRRRSENTTFDLTALITEVRNQLLSRWPGDVLIRGDLPQVTGDRARLMLVFKHLIENGLKFNRHRVPTVEVSCKDLGQEWRFDVSDNGLGIPVEDHDRVFELFQRLHAPEDFPGSGTGLNISRRIAQDHRGRISVESLSDGGTLMSVHLPKDGSRLTSPGFRLTSDGRIEPVRKS